MPNYKSISKTIGLAANLCKHFAARTLHLPSPMPINYTLSLTYRCQSRCQTCRIYERTPVNELTLEEWRKVFQGIKNVYWVTFSGGEPFLRTDIVEIYKSLISTCHPAIVNIPTNGIALDIFEKIKEMAEFSPETKLVMNVSIDHNLPERMNEIRGNNKAWRSLVTFGELKNIKLPNLTVGIHTVISQFNAREFHSICDGLLKLGPDQYITEIAENRFELGTMGIKVAPGSTEYILAIEYLQKRIKETHWKSTAKITEAFRLLYYKHVIQYVRHKDTRTICYAGRGNVQVTPDGEVWACCIKAISMGNLRDYNYNLRKLLYSQQAKNVIQATGGCACPMANISYLNMLFSPKSLLEVARRILIT